MKCIHEYFSHYTNIDEDEPKLTPLVKAPSPKSLDESSAAHLTLSSMEELEKRLAAEFVADSSSDEDETLSVPQFWKTITKDTCEDIKTNARKEILELDRQMHILVLEKRDLAAEHLKLQESGSSVDQNKIKQNSEKISSIILKKKEIEQKERDDVNRIQKEENKLCEKLATMNAIPSETVKGLRKKIRNEVEKIRGTFSVDTLPKLLSLYDKYFFNNKLKEVLKLKGKRLFLCFNNRCTKAGGYMKPSKRTEAVEIHIATKPMKEAMKLLKEGKHVTSGNIEVSTILEAIMLTFEHELVHAILEFFCFEWGTSDKHPGNYKGAVKPGNGHSKTFMSILYNLFGHTDFHHNLKGREVVSPRDMQNAYRDTKLGDIVAFVARGGNKYIGIVAKKNPKNAQVVVHADQYPEFKSDVKFRVPYLYIEHVGKEGQGRFYQNTAYQNTAYQNTAFQRYIESEETEDEIEYDVLTCRY